MRSFRLLYSHTTVFIAIHHVLGDMSCDLEIRSSIAAATGVDRVRGARSLECSDLPSCVKLHFNNIGFFIIWLITVSRTSELMPYGTTCNPFRKTNNRPNMKTVSFGTDN